MRLLIFMGTTVTVISLLLDNVTTVIIFGPLIILICQAMKISPIPYLLAAALLSDTGGVATLVGDPPNLMIGSSAGIDFNTFFIHMGPPVAIAWLAILFALKYLFRKELSNQHTHEFESKARYKKQTSLAKILVSNGTNGCAIYLSPAVGLGALDGGCNGINYISFSVTKGRFG